MNRRSTLSHRPHRPALEGEEPARRLAAIQRRIAPGSLAMMMFEPHTQVQFTSLHLPAGGHYEILVDCPPGVTRTTPDTGRIRALECPNTPAPVSEVHG